jgi:MFS family permease
MRLLSLVLVGRLPNGMVPLALVLYARGSGHSWGSAGGLAAAYSGGNAVGAPLLARWMDRRGQTAVLVATAVVSAAALLAVPRVPSAAAFVVGLAGFAFPPLEQAQRVLWPRLLPAEQVSRAYALDATAQGLIFVLGPPFVLAGIAAAGSSGGLIAAGVIGLAGTLGFAAAPPSRAWRPAPDRQATHWAGPLRSGRLIGVYIALALVGVTVGTLAVGLTAYAEDLGNRSLGGWLLTANALGGFAGGLAFAASRRWSNGDNLGGRAAAFTATFGIVWAALAALPPLPLMATVAVACGALLPPLLTCIYLAIDRLAPAAEASEAFGWAITAFLVGFSAGAAVAGTFVALHLPLAFLLGSAASLVAAATVRAAIPVSG